MPGFTVPPISSRFADCLPVILRAEGGFVDDPDDPGGRTNKGITQKTYTAWLTRHGEPSHDVKDIPDADVAAIYEADYWDASGAARLAPPLDLIHFDCAVNCGVGRAAKLLGRAAGTARGYMAVREQYYRDLVKSKPQLAKFLPGWLNRLKHLRTAAGIP